MLTQPVETIITYQ